jgi:hypothetical protein
MTLSPRVGWKSQKAIRCVRKKSEACLRHGTKRPSEVAAGGMDSNHRLVLFTHALCRLSYPATLRTSAPGF